MSAPYYLRSVAGGHHKPGAVNALPDLLDAAVLPELLAAALDEGHHAGHEEARAVHPTYCGAIWPLCGHHHLSTMPTDDDERTTHE